MVTQVGMEALLKPRIDDREANQEVQRIERKVDPMNIEADIDAGGVGDDLDVGGVGAGARAGGGGGGFLAGAVGGRAAGGAGAGLGGLAKGAALPVAISGVVGFGLLKAAEEMAAASPHLQKQTSLIQKANENWLRPVGEWFSKNVSGGLVEDYYKRSVEWIKAWDNDPVMAIKDAFIDAFGVLSPIGLTKTAVDALDRLVRGPQTIEERANALDPRGEGSRAPNFGNLRGLADIAQEEIGEAIDERIPKINWGEVINPVEWGRYIKQLVWDDVLGPKIPSLDFDVPDFPGWGELLGGITQFGPLQVGGAPGVNGDKNGGTTMEDIPEADLKRSEIIDPMNEPTGQPRTVDERARALDPRGSGSRAPNFGALDENVEQDVKVDNDTKRRLDRLERQQKQTNKHLQDVVRNTGRGTTMKGPFAGRDIDSRSLSEMITEANQTHDLESEVFQ